MKSYERNDSSTIELFQYILTNAKYPRLENLYKILIEHLHKMAQAR